jgi:SAM-dependent methyltransferase
VCNIECIRFGRENLHQTEVQGKRVLEIGSHDVNGSLRSFVQSLGPSEYIGVDVQNGYGVDIVGRAEEVRDRFDDQSFDVVISTELMEHVLDWRKVISNMKWLCRPEGIVLITTRSYGFEYHGWPYDFWRFEVSDMEEIFSDFIIENIATDALGPGVFIKTRRPADFVEKDLSRLKLYSIVAGRRLTELDHSTLERFREEHAQEYRALERRSWKGRARRLVRDQVWKLRKLVR